MLLKNMIWVWSNVARIRPGVDVTLLICCIGVGHVMRRSIVLYELISEFRKIFCSWR